MVRISKQIDRKRKLVTKVLVRVDLVFADADNSDIRVVKLLKNPTPYRFVYRVDFRRVARS